MWPFCLCLCSEAKFCLRRSEIKKVLFIMSMSSDGVPLAHNPAGNESQESSVPSQTCSQPLQLERASAEVPKERRTSGVFGARMLSPPWTELLPKASQKKKKKKEKDQKTSCKTLSDKYLWDAQFTQGLSTWKPELRPFQHHSPIKSVLASRRQSATHPKEELSSQQK